jgi:hypothetical protein
MLLSRFCDLGRSATAWQVFPRLCLPLLFRAAIRAARVAFGQYGLRPTAASVQHASEPSVVSFWPKNEDRFPNQSACCPLKAQVV